MIKTVAAISAAALFAGVITLLPVISLRVEASTPQAAPKADRIDMRARGTACSQQGWPHFEPACLRDARETAGAARAVRIISTDRLAISGK
jgi:hypothetical protein